MEAAHDREHLVERSFGSFRRSIRLPFAPEPKSVTASCKDGIAVVTMPSAAGAGNTHRIPVGAGPATAAPATHR